MVSLREESLYLGSLHASGVRLIEGVIYKKYGPMRSLGVCSDSEAVPRKSVFIRRDSVFIDGKLVGYMPRRTLIQERFISYRDDNNEVHEVREADVYVYSNGVFTKN